MTWGWDSIRIQWLQQYHIACSVQVKWLPLNFKWVVGNCYYYVSRRKIVGMCSSHKNVCIIILCLTHILPFAFRFIRWGVDCWRDGKSTFFDREKRSIAVLEVVKLGWFRLYSKVVINAYNRFIVIQTWFISWFKLDSNVIQTYPNVFKRDSNVIQTWFKLIQTWLIDFLIDFQTCSRGNCSLFKCDSKWFKVIQRDSNMIHRFSIVFHREIARYSNLIQTIQTWFKRDSNAIQT